MIGSAVVAVKIEAVAVAVLEVLTAKAHGTSGCQFAINEVVPLGIGVIRMLYILYGRSRIAEVAGQGSGYVRVFGARTVYSVIHLHSHTAVPQQSCHVVVAVGTAQYCVPVVGRLLVVVDVLIAVSLAVVAEFARRTLGPLSHTHSLSHSYSHATYYGLAVAVLRTVLLVRSALVPVDLDERCHGSLRGTCCGTKRTRSRFLCPSFGYGCEPMGALHYALGEASHHGAYALGLALCVINARVRVAYERLRGVVGGYESPSLGKLHYVVGGCAVVADGSDVGTGGVETLKAAAHNLLCLGFGSVGGDGIGNHGCNGGEGEE